jgi:hypothetical protein
VGGEEERREREEEEEEEERVVNRGRFWFPFGTSLFNLSTSTSLPPRKPNQTTDKASSPSTAASSGPTA